MDTGEWIRRGLGVAVLAGVVAIALGADTGVLSRVSYASTTSLEQGLIDKVRPPGGRRPAAMTPSAEPEAAGTLPVIGPMPSLDGATLWLNSPPLTREALRGNVVLVDNAYAIWRAFNNDSWPAHCFIDAKGRIRYEHSGEGEYGESEKVI